MHPKSVRHVSFQVIYLSLAVIGLRRLVLIGFLVLCCPVLWPRMTQDGSSVRLEGIESNREGKLSRPDGPGSVRSYDLIRAAGGFPSIREDEGGVVCVGYIQCFHQ